MLDPAGGTIVCGVGDAARGRVAGDVAAALSERLAMRLVLVHVVAEGPVPPADALERRVREETALEALAGELHAVEARIVVGSVVDGLARVAAEEGADLIVLGSRELGAGRGRLRCRLARDLEAATPVPILIAPPTTRRRSRWRLASAPR
jgi:nucleotide-binding universal stress UspA family protein